MRVARLNRLPTWLLAALALPALLTASVAAGWLLPADSAQAQSGQSVPADWPLIPRGIEPGDSFRLLFVTSATRDASSADIADYNAHVQGAANGNASLKSFKNSFTALISTASVNIKDNSATTGTGVPVHWLRGDKVADDYADFYDLSWDSVSGKTETGGSYTGLVWTGGNGRGETSLRSYAGAAQVRMADLGEAKPLSSPTTKASGESYPLYGLSPVLTVAEPEPEPTPTPTPQPANSPPQFDTDTTDRSVDENSADGTNVGEPVTATDADGDALTYSITGSGAFAIRESTGQITVSGSLDYETQASYTLTVTATDPEDAADTIAVTVNVGNVDEAGAVSLSADPPQAGSPLTATLLDPDGGVSGETWSWARSADQSTWETIDGATGAAYTPSDDDADYHLRATASYTDGHGPGKTARGSTANAVAAAPATPEPEPPAITAGPAIVSSPASGDTYGKDEVIVVAVTFSEAVTVTGQPQVRLTVGERQRRARYERTEQDGTVLVFTYQVKKVDADPDGISIEANQVLLRGGSVADGDGNAASLNHAALPAQSGHKVDGSQEAAGEQQQSPPPSNSPAAFAGENAALSVDEDAAVGTNVGGAIVATDADGDTLTYALSGSDAFAIGESSGQITVRAALDHETQSSYALTVTVSDGKNTAGEADNTVDDTIAVTVSVGNADEAGVVSLEAEPDPPETGGSLTASLADPDGGVSGLAWSWQRSADGSAWDTITGATGASYTLTAVDGAHYLRATASYADAQGAGKTAQAALEQPVSAVAGTQETQTQTQTQGQAQTGSTPSGAASGTTIWFAELTVDKDVDLYGCNNDEPDQDNCSSSTVSAITDDDFTYANVDYTVKFIHWDSSGNKLEMGFTGATTVAQNDVIKEALTGLKLYVDGQEFAVADTVTTVAGFNWLFDPATDWADDQTVSLELIELPPLPPHDTIWSATLTVDEHTVPNFGTSFGCDDHEDELSDCGTGQGGSALTENTFTYQGQTYRVDQFFWNTRANALFMKFWGVVSDDDTAVIQTSLGQLTLVVDGTPIAVSGGKVEYLGLNWDYDPATNWTDGQEVSVSLVEFHSLWSAVLTVDRENQYRGCDNTDTAFENCSDPTVLDELNYFTHAGVEYTIDKILYNSRNNTLGMSFRELTGAKARDVFKLLTLNVDGQQLAFSHDKKRSNITWDFEPATNWKEGQKVALSLTSNAEPACETSETGPTRCWVPYDWELLPSGAGLEAEDNFRLMFITSTGRTATETGIGPYNTHVQGIASSPYARYALRPLKDHFRAMVNTQEAAGRLRPNTWTRAEDPGAGDPIYWTNGDKVADNYADLYDGSWDHNSDDSANDKWASNETGNDVRGGSDFEVWTGSKPDGGHLPGYEMGQDNVVWGSPNVTGRELGAASAVTTGTGTTKTVHPKGPGFRSLYAISPVLTVGGDPLAPSRPTGLVAYARDEGIRLEWDAPQEGYGYIDRAQVQYRQGSDSSWGDWTDTLVDDEQEDVTDLTNGIKYEFRVRRVGKNGSYSAPSAAAEGTPQATPPAPRDLVANSADSSVILHWWPPGNEDIEKYQYRWSYGPRASWEGGWRNIPESNDETYAYTVEGLLPVDYSFSVRAVSKDHGAGDATKRVTARVQAPAAAPDAIEVDYNWALLPRDDQGECPIEPGDSFRLLFVTKDTTRAVSTNINDYNTFVQNQAAQNSHFSGDTIKLGFRAMISTAAVHARDNTAVPAGVENPPVYWVGGTQLTRCCHELYREWPEGTQPRTQDGKTTDVNRVWTGSTSKGYTWTAFFLHRYAGAKHVITGNPSSADDPIIDYDGNPLLGTKKLPIYGISPVFIRGQAP